MQQLDETLGNDEYESTDETDGISLDELGGEDFDDYFEDEQPERTATVVPPSFRPVNHSASVRTSPMFQHAEQFPSATQYRVYHLNEGQPHSVGVIAIDATEAEFIQKFRSACPGKFILRPVDEVGNYLGGEFTHQVSPHHPSLEGLTSAEKTESRNDGDLMLTVMQQLEQRMEAKERRFEQELRRKESQYERERDLIQQQRDELAAERVAMAAQASATTANISERQLEAVANQHQEAFAAMGQLFQNTNSMMQQMIQWQAQNHQQAMERAKSDQQHALDRERQAQERERERERARAKESRLLAEQARENDRAHFRAITEMQQNNSTLGGAKKMLNEFGLKPVDMLKVFQQGEGDPSTGNTLISVLGDVAKSFASASGEAAKAQAQAQTQQLALAAQMQGQQIEPQPEQSFIDADYDEDDEEYFDEPIQPQPDQAGSSPEVLAAFREPETSSSLPLSVQKSARMSIRKLVSELAKSASDEWQGKVIAAVTTNLDIVEYIREKTIRAALIEGGAKNGLENHIIDAINATGLVPDDIPRG